MKALRRLVAVVCLAIAIFLVVAVIHAIASPGGARAGVAVGYIAGAIVLTAVARWLWRIRGKRKTAGTNA